MAAQSTNGTTQTSWQVRYKDQKGEMIRESAATPDREQAERFLRDRLDARDEGRLSVLLGSKRLTFNEWADWFLEKRSKPPFRSAGNHEVNLNALKSLRPVFGETALSDITSEGVENYLPDRLQSRRRIRPNSESNWATLSNRQRRTRSFGF